MITFMKFNTSLYIFKVADVFSLHLLLPVERSDHRILNIQVDSLLLVEHSDHRILNIQVDSLLFYVVIMNSNYDLQTLKKNTPLQCSVNSLRTLMSCTFMDYGKTNYTRLKTKTKQESEFTFL